MYTILVVEDMDLTREDLMHLVSWENYGFRLLGGMKNGQTGLEYARRYHPDIILTDIKMPVMTGLEMVEELRKSGMDTQVILLTAYEEFGLVKHAMDLGITRFLMKYEIDEELLLKELNGCVEEIQKKQAMDSFHERSRIRLLLKGKPESEGFEKPVKWPGKTTLVLFQILDGLLETGEEELQELFQQRLPKEEFLTLRLDAGRFVILRKDGLYLSEVQDQESVRGFIRQVQYVLDTKLGLTAAAAYHGKIREAQEVSVCYQDADQILKGIVFSGGSRILETFPETSKEPLPKELSEDLEELEKSYKKQEFQDIEAILERLKGRLKKQKNLYWYGKCTDRMLSLAVWQSSQMRDGAAEEALEHLKEGSAFLNLEQFWSAYLDVAALLGKHGNAKEYSGNVNAMLQFVKEHYQEGIGLTEVAKELHMNPMYLSRLFKQETGTAFSAYVTQIRIEKAVELLKSGNYKIYEVSEMTGYQTVQYFSKAFKKVTGKNPKDYFRA